MVNSSTISGCCAATNLYNLGGAHGHATAANQEEFEISIRGIGFSSITIALTNPEQTRVREYLKTCGFTPIKCGDRLQTHVIYGPDLAAYLNKRGPHLAEYTRKKNEIKLEKKKAKFAVAQGQEDPPVGVRRNGIFPGDITLARVSALRPVPFNRNVPNDLLRWQIAVNNFFNTNINIDRNTASWPRPVRDRVYRDVYRQRQRAGLL